MHVRDFISFGTDAKNQNKNENYARFVLGYLILPAYKKPFLEKFVNENCLWCDYLGMRHLVHGVSESGQLILKDHKLSTNFINADVSMCSRWSSVP